MNPRRKNENYYSWNESSMFYDTMVKTMLGLAKVQASAARGGSGGVGSGTAKPMSWRTPSVSCLSSRGSPRQFFYEMSLLKTQLDEIFRVLGFACKKRLDSACKGVLEVGSLDIIAPRQKNLDHRSFYTIT